MLFNSLAFIIFLPIVLIGFSILKRHRIWFLLVASYFFIGWWHWEYLGLIILSTLVDYFASLQLGKPELSQIKRRMFLGLSISVNLGLLFFFKYFNFFNGQLDAVFQSLRMDYLIPYSDFLLPMGISFYTFQTLSYTIDVYNGKLKPEGNFSVFALYVSFFPQLVAGPIERAGNLIGQLRNLQSIVVNNFTSGMSRILMGLFKKLVIADRLALFVDPVFDNPEGYDGLLLIIAAIFFAFQIYCDFSGYSDMAIGIARIFGVRLVENFNSPYLAPNLSNFWGRWHISLNTWFIDYLYTPIALNRRHWAKYGVIFAIFITFTTSGLWHGANFTFIA
jgi:alginate O-acetyltransferase complex protein AlgI